MCSGPRPAGSRYRLATSSSERLPNLAEARPDPGRRESARRNAADTRASGRPAADAPAREHGVAPRVRTELPGRMQAVNPERLQAALLHKPGPDPRPAPRARRRARDRWIGWDRGLRSGRLHLVPDSSRFPALPGAPRSPGSRVLSPVARRVVRDRPARFGHGILPLEIFVDRSRFAGSCYRAANWMPWVSPKGSHGFPAPRRAGRRTDSPRRCMCMIHVAWPPRVCPRRRMRWCRTRCARRPPGLPPCMPFAHSSRKLGISARRALPDIAGFGFRRIRHAAR